MTYKKKAIPEGTRRSVALRYGCEPGGVVREAPCHWCGTPGTITWHRLADGRPSSWVTFTDLELDHVVPEVYGGTGDPSNIVLACQPCNRRLGHRSRVPHGSLSEEGLPNSPVAHPRKGREGKGRDRNGKDLFQDQVDDLTVGTARSGRIGFGASR